jgi:phage terminase large subunit GpA-like protein
MSLTLPVSIQFTPGEARVFRGKEIDPITGRPITVAQWAERYRTVTDGDKTGRWLNANSPYAVEPMNCWTIPSIQEIYLCFAPQVVKTQIAFNCLAYSIDQDPGPIMYVMPDEKLANRLSKNRLIPMIEKTPRLSSLLTPRSEDVTRTSVRFLNGVNLVMAWATSVAELSSDPIRYAVADEVSKFPDYSGGAKKESSPFDLLRQRTNSFPFTKKILALSTPGAAPCPITRLMRYEADIVYRYQVPCPICGTPQIMEDESIVVLRNIKDPLHVKREKLGRYSCVSCGMFWDDYLRNQAVMHGIWVPGAFNSDGDWQPCPPLLRPVSVAFHLPSWYSLNISLSDVSVARLRAVESPQKMMVYVTQHKTEEYKEVVDAKKDSQILARRTQLPSGIVPAAVLALTCGVDSHTWGFRFSVYAWIENEIGYTLHKILHGQLGTLADVKKLVFESRFPVENSSETLGIWRSAIDTGGGKLYHDSEKTMTDMIYNWLREISDQARVGLLPPGKIVGIKGASQKQGAVVRPTMIDKLPGSGKLIPGGLELRIIDTYQLKINLHWRLARKEDEDQNIFFDADTTEEFARELLAEEFRRKLTGHAEWTKIRPQNHYLDTTIYAMACGDGEWQPSLKILTPRIKELRPQSVAAQRLSDTMPHPTGVTIRPAPQHDRYARPDMERLRERMADRRNR